MLAIYLALAAPSAASIIDQTVAAHGRMSRLDATIATDTKLQGQEQKSTAHLLVVRPDRLRLTVQEPQQNGQAASRRIYCLDRNRFVAIDDLVREYTDRQYQFKSSLSLFDRLQISLGAPNDAVSNLLDSKQLAIFFTKFRSLPDLKVSTDGAMIRLRRSSGAARIAFDIGAADHLLRRVRLDNEGGFLDWEFSYGPSPSSISPPSTRGMRKVESLVARDAPPTYASDAAHLLAKKSQFAYDSLRSVDCHYEGADGSGRFWIASGHYRQESGGTAWIYADRTLTAKNRASLYRGRVAQSKVSSALHAVGISVQPMLLQIMEHRNPMGTLMPTKSRVRIAGEISLGGQPCGILEIRTNGVTVSVAVRKSDGMILSSRANIPGPNGTLLRQETTFTYDSVNKPLPAGAFAPPAGSAKPFPKF